MKRRAAHCIISIFFLTSSTLFFACGGPYQGAACEVTDDCHSEHQNVPGTICVDEVCECWEPGKVVCCARGEREPGCILECRSCDECGEDRPAECEGVPEPPGGCESDAECPGPPDARCGAGRCVEGACEVEITVGPLGSQLRGDCKQDECTKDGRVVNVAAYDIYNDGNECTNDLCDYDTPVNAQLTGVLCPVSGAGRCHEGQCVECIDSDPTMPCPNGLVCDGTLCVRDHCVNNRHDPGLGETDYNCGGPCKPCPMGFDCATGDDCLEGVCDSGICRAPTCADGAKNGVETGVDCGAPCPRCAPEGGCKTGADCTSGVCWAGACEAPACTDGMKNGGERGVDCGGECDAECPG
ncbi:hypothetical protein [Sorangium sp. So ce1153]|uniref:hypothetical protein n=1 Tax=Sorangium sp. So ce1153 TaxID=3133333 RepID=UPI003F624883